jgi:hypothetical protein
VVIVTKGGETDLHALAQYFDAALRSVGAPAGHLLVLTDNEGAELEAEAVGRNWETKPISLQAGQSVMQRHFYSPTWVSLLPLAFKRQALKDMLGRVAPHTRSRGEGLDGFVKLGAWLRGWAGEGKNRVALLLPAALEGVGPLVSRLVEPSLLHGQESILVSYYGGRAPPLAGHRRRRHRVRAVGGGRPRRRVRPARAGFGSAGGAGGDGCFARGTGGRSFPDPDGRPGKNRQRHRPPPGRQPRGPRDLARI